VKIVIISRGEIFASPTVLNYIQAFLSLGNNVVCICSSCRNNIKEDRVSIYQTEEPIGKNLFSKIFNFWRFRKRTLKVIKENNLKSNAIFWVARIDTAIAFGEYFKNEKSVLSLHELHDQFLFWKYITQKVIRYYDQIVFNEYNRANIAKVWYKLLDTPNIIPNKPMYHSRERNAIITNLEIQNIIYSIKSFGKKIIIYQGSLLSDRNLDPLVKATYLLRDRFQLILMGKDIENRVPSFMKINPNLIHIPWVAPPDHLNVTSHCHIGVAFYDYDSLNSIYCAPNKIWEYSGFSIPILAQNIPGLYTTIGVSNAGVCVDLNNQESIIDAIMELDNNYHSYSVNSRDFYDSVDFKESVGKVLYKLIK
jgi:glycosyltransferase involved in cell wall biosynthesis